MNQLENDFTNRLFRAYQIARDDVQYNATIFLKMLSEDGGKLTAKKLINANKPSDGYRALWERGRLDLTVEAIVLSEGKWHPLFTDEELGRAEARLREYDYEIPHLRR